MRHEALWTPDQRPLWSPDEGWRPALTRALLERQVREWQRLADMWMRGLFPVLEGGDAVVSHDNYETIATVLSTEFNSLANNGYTAASAAQGADGTGGPLLADWELACASYNPTAQTVMELYVTPSVDGTNYATAPSSTNGLGPLMRGVFVTATGSATKNTALVDLPNPPGLWKAYGKNTAGPAMAASGSTLKVRAHNLQTA